MDTYPLFGNVPNTTPLPKVTPPFQRVDKDLKPISLTLGVSKVLESFVHSWMWCIIKEKIDKGQFGAIIGSCTTFSIIKIIVDWMSATDDWHLKNHVQIILLDYANININLNILMKKLSDLG